MRRLLLAVLVLVAALLAPAAAGGTHEVLALDRGELQLRFVGRPSPPPAEVTLPLHWDAHWPRAVGWAQVRIRFAAPAGHADEPQALLVSRIGNAYRVKLNGQVIAAAGKLEQINDGWSNRRPLWLRVPPSLLRDGENLLEIAVRADPSRRAGIAPVRLGAERLLQPQWDALEWRHVTLPRVITLFSLLVAVFCLMLWAQQREAVYGWAALCEALWSLRIAATWWEEGLLAWPSWFKVVLAVFWLGHIATYLVIREVWHGRPRREQWLVWGVLGLGPVALALGTLQQTQNWVLGWILLLVAGWLALSLRLGWETWRQRAGERAWMLLILVAGWVALVRDSVIARLLVERFDEAGWTKFAAVLVSLAILAIVGIRFQRTREELRQLHLSLEDRIRLRESELADKHAELRRLEHASAVAAERARILRDMHDGAGAHLITAMLQLERGVATKSEVMQTLRESLDQLRLSIDAINLPAGDANALLASMRFRLQPRIEAAGLALDWSVANLPRWRCDSDEATRHLQYMLLEAISNVLQHARARVLAVSAAVSTTVGGDAIEIVLRDDGCGLGEARGNGLRSMRQRAAQAGVELRIEKAEPGTRVVLRLPLA
ncbi:sensor histidine kinase [Variovorax sp. Varisp41]|uniref:sensor histidine kinase n=1 Tax=Variovorax sp. Varisp41 TaxID=3243033 RepID=UPI0039B5BDB2